MIHTTWLWYWMQGDFQTGHICMCHAKVDSDMVLPDCIFLVWLPYENHKLIKSARWSSVGVTHRRQMIHTRENWSLDLSGWTAERTVLWLNLWQTSIMPCSCYTIAAFAAYQNCVSLVTQDGTRGSFWSTVMAHWHTNSSLWKERPTGFPLTVHLIKQVLVSTTEMVHSPSCCILLFLLATQRKWRYRDSSIPYVTGQPSSQERAEQRWLRQMTITEKNFCSFAPE